MDFAGWRVENGGLYKGCPFPFLPKGSLKSQGRAKEGEAESMPSQILRHSCPPSLPQVPLIWPQSAGC